MRKSHLLILGLILLIGLFLRSYQLFERFEFAHDGDLYSWIVKDIVVNHHFRLIGQLTSAPGIFIGGLFYYLLIPFFLLSKMDPIGVTFFAIIIGLSTIVSYYFVFAKLFKIEVGLIAAFLYATLIKTINADRWVVPTITTNLWVVWYFFILIKIARGDFRVLPLLGILIGLIWHVHIALIPTLIAFPVALILSKKLPSAKQVALSLILFLITSLPFFIFEAKQGFGQIQSLITNSQAAREGPVGVYKLTLISGMITKNINDLLFTPLSLNITNNIFFILIILLSAFWLVKKENLSKKELVIFLIWILGVVTFFEVSSSPISEYYFSNIEVIFITIISLYLYILLKASHLGKTLVISLLLLILIKNAYSIVNQNYYQKGYIEKKEAVDYIVKDAREKNFPCFSINYITAPGENVGFRYFFYLKQAKLAVPGHGSPVYNIVIPDEYALNEVKVKFGHIGVIPPTEINSGDVINEACSGQNTNLTDPMFGFVD